MLHTNGRVLMILWLLGRTGLRFFVLFLISTLRTRLRLMGGSIVRNIIEETMIGNDKSMTTKDHVATDPQSVELRRSTRERKANPKYNKG
jgi:hypothetical protein